MGLKRKCLNTLCKICGHHALLPSPFQISICFDRSEEALYSGGYADVWMGKHQGHKVAVKVLKVYSTSNLDKITSVRHHPRLFKVCIEELMVIVIAQTFCKEVVTWKNLCHPNVLPLMGLTMGKKVLCDDFRVDGQWEYH